MITGDADELRGWREYTSRRLKSRRLEDARRDMEAALATVGEARQTIRDLDEFAELQKERLRAAKKEMGTIPPKESAAKILRYESRIEKAGAKKARAERRLRRAQKRIDSGAEILDNYKDYEKGSEMSENEVRPLFTEEPQIMDAANAFKPVSFDEPKSAAPAAMTPPMPIYAPAAPAAAEPQAAPQPLYRNDARNLRPAEPEIERPQAPISGIQKINAPQRRGQGGAYYLMLLLLIGLSIYTLYLYQQKMNSEAMPHIAATTEKVAETSEPSAGVGQPEVADAPAESPFITEEPIAPVREPAPAPEPVPGPLPEPAPDPIPAPEAAPELESMPDPISAPESAPELVSGPESAPEPMLGPEPVPIEESQLPAVMPESEPQIIEDGFDLELPAEETPADDDMPIDGDAPLEYEQGDGAFEDSPDLGEIEE
jgi:hypothetical protein